MRKFFDQDKNYILHGAQFDLEDELITFLINRSKEYYLQVFNPLGLIDDTVSMITNHVSIDTSPFLRYYESLAAVYRYKYGSNQLEFLFDGMDHYTKYSRDWSHKFEEWTNDFLIQNHFLKTVLQLSVFKTEGYSRELAEGRLKNFISQQFDLKIYKYRGIVVQAA